MARKIKIPANMPANAFGFIALRPRDEHPAFFNRDGELQCTFAYGATDDEIAACCGDNFRVEGIFVFTRHIAV